MRWVYKGEMTFEDAVEKYGKKLPDMEELKEIPIEVLKQSKDCDAWGIVFNKKGQIQAAVRWADYIFIHVYLFNDPYNLRGVFIEEETEKQSLREEKYKEDGDDE